MPGFLRPVVRSAYSLRLSSIGTSVLLRRIEGVTGPQAKEPLENGSESESRDNVARPVRQNYYSRQREPNRERSDRPTGSSAQRAGGRGQRSHVQRMA